VHNQFAHGTSNVGSGTLIDVTPRGERGLVLTCAHLFTEGRGNVVVEFPGGETHGALVVAADAGADLAALEIARPTAPPAGINLQLNAADALRACGFGGDGQFKCARGRLLGYSESPGQVSLRIAGPVRSGDSGGGVFDQQGRLCAVVWGETGGVTYASTGRPLAAFLNRVLGSHRGTRPSQPAATATICPDGRCPLVKPAPIAAAPAVRSPAPRAPRPASPPVAGLAPLARSCDCEGKLAAIAARLDALQGANQDARPVVSPPSTFSGAARAAAALAVAALGVSGPAGLGAIAAATVGGWLIGRRLKRSKLRSGGARQQTPDTRQPTTSEATAAADARFPIERDDREARELLRLSQLEGRDPLQDALAGRLALDRLDQIAEGDADSNQASWADHLRRELREKFNEIAPTKFQLRTEL
jgi:hypothetical protein